MAKKQRAGNSYKVQYTAYKASMRFRTNRLAKITKHCENYPEDKQAEKALERLLKEVPYRRRKPIQRGVNSPNYPIHSSILDKDKRKIIKALIMKSDLYPNKFRELRPLNWREKLIRGY